jgi:GxxExxY protein
VLPLFSVVQVPANLESVTSQIIGCAIKVHSALGAGLLESIYRECMCLELAAADIPFVRERPLAIRYRGAELCNRFKVDLIVGDCVVVELKAVDGIHPVYLAQVITYLKLTNCPAGLLINFNATTVRAGLRRLTHPDLYPKGPLGP